MGVAGWLLLLLVNSLCEKMAHVMAEREKGSISCWWVDRDTSLQDTILWGSSKSSSRRVVHNNNRQTIHHRRLYSRVGCTTRTCVLYIQTHTQRETTRSNNTTRKARVYVMSCPCCSPSHTPAILHGVFPSLFHWFCQPVFLPAFCSFLYASLAPCKTRRSNARSGGKKNSSFVTISQIKQKASLCTDKTIAVFSRSCVPVPCTILITR